MADATPGTEDASQAKPSLDLTLDATLASAGHEARRPGASATRGEPARGATIGRYVVLAKLGAGAMGVVLSAYDPELDRKVALKLLKVRGGARTEAARARLQREAQALAKLNHTNVVGVHDVGVHEGQVFVAMEFVDGQTLGDWAESAPAGKVQPWREVVKIFHAAGAGLAAAHAQGLIHRDFKPDNVMLGKDGRVRVMDFGLARANEGQDEVSSPADLDALTSGGQSPLNNPLTQTGAVMGTPAYMSPEQFTGIEVTAQSDQFGYCAALFEALYGQRPFSGETLAALAFAVSEGNIISTPNDGVPVWLRRLVLKGLAPNPQHRFADMSTLLIELGAGETRRRRNRTLTVVGVLGLGLAGVLGYQRWDEAQRTAACEADGDRVAEVWNDDARTKLREGLLSTQVVHAESAVEKTLPYFDAQAERIRDAQREACLDTRVRRIWTEDLLDRATWCIDERRMELEALAAELSTGDEHSAREAVSAASGLSQIESCRATHQLLQSPTPPDDRAGVQAVRKDLSQASALASAGKYKDALAKSKEALANAEASAWPALTASARLSLGKHLKDTGDYEQAARSLETAYFTAAELGLRDLELSAATQLTLVEGSLRAKHAQGQRWAKHASLALARLQTPATDLRRATYLTSLAAVLSDLGDYAGARALFEQAMSIQEASLGSEHPRLAVTIGSLAGVLRKTGDYAEARVLFERTISIKENALGTEHPALAGSINNLAGLLMDTGEFSEARILHERAMSMLEKALGPEHPNFAIALNNLANVLRGIGDNVEARSLLERAVSIAENALGSDHPTVATLLSNLASVVEATGDYAGARPLFERAISIKERALGPEHRSLATSLLNLASLLRKTGDNLEAQTLYRRAVSILEKALGPEHPEIAYAMTGLSAIASERSQTIEALTFAEKGLRLREAAEVPPHVLAGSQFALAKALWATAARSNRERAVSLAKQAADAYRTAEGQEKSLATVSIWLAEHKL